MFATHDCDSARSAAAEGRIPQRGFPVSKMYVYDWSFFFFKVSSGGILEGGEMEEIFFFEKCWGASIWHITQR